VKKGVTGTLTFSSRTFCSVVYFPSLRRSEYEDGFPSFSTDKKRTLGKKETHFTNVCEHIARENVLKK
jgi:hypothetical protein